MTLPPLVSGGLPVVGHLTEMMNDRTTLFKRGYAEHGDVFAVKVANKHILVVSGAENNRLFYQQTDKTLNIEDGYAFLKEAFGEVLFVASVESYTKQRPLLQEIFKRERMIDYVRAMQIEVQRWLDSLGEAGEVDMAHAMLRVTQNVAGHALIGPNFRDELGDAFWDQYRWISESIDNILPPKLPLPKFIRRDRAKKVIRRIMGEVISKRRQNPDKYDDLISTVLTTPQKDGSYLSDEGITNLFMGLLFAGHETTAGQAAWTIAQLLQHPEFLALVQDEISENVAYGAAFDGKLLSQLDHLYMAIDETTRMNPSADAQIRTLSEPMTIGGYDVPAGWVIMVNSANSHHLPDVFRNPDEYDPLRFSDERNEGKNPFSIVGFGGGIHKCTGMNFAKNEMAIITALFFQQFDAELLSENIKTVTGTGANRPDVVRVRYQRKPLSTLLDADTIREAAAAGCPHISQHMEASAD